MMLVAILGIVHPRSVHAEASDDERIAGAARGVQAEVGVTGGTGRTRGWVDLMLPIVDDDTRVLFANARVAEGRSNTRSGSIALGVRQLDEDDGRLLGAYVAFDRRHTRRGSDFDQLAFGIEMLLPRHALRVNAYLPDTRPEITSTRLISAGGELALVGSQVVEASPIVGVSRERALRGVDAEADLAVEGVPGLWAHLGAYHFDGANAHRVTGVRGRIAYQVDRNLVVGASARHDDARGTDVNLEVRLQLPLGGSRPERTGYRLAEHMTDPLVRDEDVVVSIAMRSLRVQAPPTALLAGNGMPQRVLFVDNRAAAGGDGTRDRPFATLEAAEAASGAYDIIRVAVGDGTTRGMDTGIALQRHQQLLGEGVPLQVAGRQLLPAGGLPTITHTGIETFARFIDYPASASGIATVSAAGDNTIAGLRIGNGNALHASMEIDCFDPIRICGVQNTTVPGPAIHMVGVGSASLRVHDNEIAGASTVVQVSSPFLSGRFESAASASVDVFVQPGATLALDVRDNHFTVPAGRTGATAIRIGTQDPGSPTATAVRLSVDGNRFDGLDGRAIDVIAARGADVTLDVDRNFARTSGVVPGGGFLNVNYGYSGKKGRLVVSMDDNDISEATGDAVAFQTSPESALSFARNRIVDSAGRGVFLDTREGVTSATFTGNVITGSRGGADVALDTLPFGTARIDAAFEGNTIGTILRR